MEILITGAAGNLGTLTARHLLARGHSLRLMVHHTPLAPDLAGAAGVREVRADLGSAESLGEAVRGAGAIVHYAGVLFRPHPERFLPRTNLGYVQNLVTAATSAGVGKFALVSFPQVEGETTPERPAVGRTDGQPTSVHAQTRLAAERHLLQAGTGTGMRAVVLRSGEVYARGLRLVEAARWLLQRGLLALWPEPTWYHLIALPDYLECVARSVEDPSAGGIYLLGDDSPLPVQIALDRFARHWGYGVPRRLPRAVFPAAAAILETVAGVFGTAAPLSRDVMRLAMVSHVCDTRRMKAELLPALRYPTLEEGLELL